MELTGSRCIATLFSRHLWVRTYRFLTKNKFQVDLSWSTGVVVFTFLLKYFVYFIYESLALESMWDQVFKYEPNFSKPLLINSWKFLSFYVKFGAKNGKLPSNLSSAQNNPSRPIPTDTKNELKFLFSHFVLVSLKILWRP